MTGRFCIPGSGFAPIPSVFVALGLAGVFAAGLTGCESDPPLVADAGFTLPNHMPADVEGSCIKCHARQVNEWLGSSHNYGGGLDGTFQSLELVANYYATHRPGGDGGPRFRQSQLCIACHAPSIALYGADGKADINASLREGVDRADIDQPLPGYRRELPYPDNDADLLPPLGRAIEKAILGDGEVAPAQQRLLSFQGITCDSCHKVGAPMDDRFTDPGIPGYSTCHPDDDLDACLAIQMAECEDRTLPFNPRCLRRTRQQDPHGDPYFEHTVATVALPVERFGPVRFGPFSEEEGEVVVATAHAVSDGATDKARNFDRATYPDGTPFEDQPRDEKPFIQSSQFCGACHDVRLMALPEPAEEAHPGNGRNTRLEPVHNEPFLRLENLYTEWFQSPLNLHPDQRGDDPDRPWPGNPFRNPDGSARRVVCQDCHMSLHPFAPPGTFPGDYTHGDACDEGGECGLTIATEGAVSDLRIRRRPRVTTHNMAGVDLALGGLLPVDPALWLPSTMLPNNAAGDDSVDEVYGLPSGVDPRRKRLLQTAVSVSLAGTPEVVQRNDNNCDEEGTCNLPVKVWVTNINGGHNVAAGFSQERQIWVEFTIQDMGRPPDPETGLHPVVDCVGAGIEDLYNGERIVNGYPVRTHPDPDSDLNFVKRHTVESANELVDRMTGLMPGVPIEEQPHFHERICRGMSGHLIDKPHDETFERAADGRLDDEDILLHRIGNTVPELTDGTQLVSWHIADAGFDFDVTELPPELSECAAPGAGVPSRIPKGSARVNRHDQFHVPGLDAFKCQLTEDHVDADLMATPELMVSTLDGRSLPLADMPAYTRSVTTTPDERLEILYPFPEYPPLLPHHDDEGHFHFGERFGLVYLTNIFYQTCNCEGGDCEGPEEIDIEFGHRFDHEGRPLPQQSYDAQGRPLPAGRNELHAQVPWLKTYPALPHMNGIANHHPLSGAQPGSTAEPYRELLSVLAADDPKIKGADCANDDLAAGAECGTTYSEAFTFVPLNADHMPNNRSLRMYKPQRHYYDIRVPADAVGPLRVSVKVWYRHFPPEFLRLMARFMDAFYRRACMEGVAQDFFPHGPIVVEGDAADLFENAANIDNLQRVMLDEAVFEVDVPGQERTLPEEVRWGHVEPIIRDHCLPCHSDALRHGGLVLGYDAWPQFDDPVGAVGPHAAQDPLAMLLGPSRFADERPLVVPGDPDASVLMALLTRDEATLKAGGIRSRPMPLGTDPLAPREIALVRRFIEQGARR